MEFTYSAYENMLNLLKENKYEFCKYGQYADKPKTVILRHDIDMDLEKALKLAELEHENCVASTYFVLISTDFYNIFSKKSNETLKQILKLGHDIGLHFDDVRYECKSTEEIVECIAKEIKILELCIGSEIKSVSMHRPSKLVLENNIEIENVINSYSKEYFENFKYISDSRMNWRENPEEIIASNKYERLHILTHAFWYGEKQENTKDIFKEFMKRKNYQNYNSLK